MVHSAYTNYCIAGSEPLITLRQPPALQILERLEYLIALVESNHDASTHVHDIHSQLPSHTDVSARLGTRMSFTPSSNADAQITSPMSHHPNLTVHDDQYEQSPLNCCAKSSEDVLEWPVFQRRYDRHSIETLIFEPTSPSEATNISGISSKILPSAAQAAYDDPREGLAKGIGICEDDVPNLVEKFLVNVHVKNPIFDPEYLRDMAREVAEDGFGWKAPSCLVVSGSPYVELWDANVAQLIVCALASISSHFVHESSLGSSREAASMDHSLANTLGYGKAEAYYTAACKRIGLLRNTLLATECYFIAGVYEMYSLRPLQAAVSFNRACVTFQTLGLMRSEYYASEDELGKARARRLYWSCLKSEQYVPHPVKFKPGANEINSETSVEINFPSSGLTQLNYTSHFPAPPLATTEDDFYRMHSKFDSNSTTTSLVRPPTELEEGWYYYLADIAARRILQRVIGSFYEADQSSWLRTPFQNMSHTASELDRQLMEW